MAASRDTTSFACSLRRWPDTLNAILCPGRTTITHAMLHDRPDDIGTANTAASLLPQHRNRTGHHGITFQYLCDELCGKHRVQKHPASLLRRHRLRYPHSATEARLYQSTKPLVRASLLFQLHRTNSMANQSSGAFDFRALPG